MRVLAALCMVALAVGQPVKDSNSHEHLSHKRSIEADGNIIMNEDNHENVAENFIEKRSVENGEDHAIQKRGALEADGNVQNDCSQNSGDASQGCGEQEVSGSAIQDDDTQEAWSNEGGYARQGRDGQYIHASDYGGPMVQILQHVYKANCCECGCDCGCPEEGAVPDDAESG